MAVSALTRGNAPHVTETATGCTEVGKGSNFGGAPYSNSPMETVFNKRVAEVAVSAGQGRNRQVVHLPPSVRFPKCGKGVHVLAVTVITSEGVRGQE